MERESFIFYRRFYEAIEDKAYSLARFDRNLLTDLPIEEKEHQFDENDPRDDEPPPF